MERVIERFDQVLNVLESIHAGINSLSLVVVNQAKEPHRESLFVPFKGAEIYLLHKAFIDAGGAPNENYKSLLEKTAGKLCSRTHQGFSVSSLCKYSDKVDPEAKENVKRFLQKMIRNIDSYD